MFYPFLKLRIEGRNGVTNGIDCVSKRISIAENSSKYVNKPFLIISISMFAYQPKVSWFFY